ncbi:Transcriptional regulator [Bosea sp. LC85]|uniref:MurR/RpiR family transcriptional regulator n=1 Tax=Bosea sp. LC85 TaxID=1502851 RepID=UPI0004E30E5C|nr:MurR/RpiR family transcriptional regulator [Bosea sp. LC85]KFC64844.1 Transcriptional regulator [Bosea sp. LC85]
MSDEHPVEAPPEDFDALRAAFAQRRGRLPKRLKQVAAFALAHPDEVAFGTAAGIAERAGVQPSTLVRLAQSLGYAGFSELQQIFRARLRARFPDYRTRVEALKPEEGASSAQRLLDGFTAAASLSLQRTRHSLRTETLEQAIALLAGAEIIHLVASRRVFPVAAYLAYAFGTLGIRAHLVDQLGQMGPEQIAMATSRDAVLAISYAPYAPATAELVGLAARAGAPVVAITDTSFSPLIEIADLWLEVAEADFGAFRSLSGSLTLAITLAVGVAEARNAG